MLETLHSLRWQDITDILLVAFIIYRAILMIRGTRAVQMLAGIGVLTVVYFGAKELELMTLYWLLGTLLNSIFLIIVIVFQRDIRKALVQVGQASPFTKPVEDKESDLHEVVTAARQLAQRKIGALIILERETGLKDYLDSGQAIDAKLSSGLLISIFMPGSPLHDGGAVVGAGRIHSARCVLPLTKSPYISKHLGTRHRAAIGLSEETDAVVVVVSEETRQISLAQHGAITTNLSEGELRNRLREILVTKKDKPASLSTLKSWLNRP
ncbi:MAG: diadenylate cyclase CdaA [Desulfobacteraceae bacterium]|nr:diadenylate cyclase CdaA [Desulfobacteraceae bacterium]